MEYIFLLGSEDVSKAGHNMSYAAQEMIKAANYVDETFRTQQRLMNEWLDRLEQVLKQSGK